MERRKTSYLSPRKILCGWARENNTKVSREGAEAQRRKQDLSLRIVTLCVSATWREYKKFHAKAQRK